MGRPLFRQRDLSRAVRGARSAGMEIARIEIDKEGVIKLIPGKPEGSEESATRDLQSNEWDSLT